VLYDVTSWDAFVVERRRVSGTFLENLELFHFPFDTQVRQVAERRVACGERKQASRAYSKEFFGVHNF